MKKIIFKMILLTFLFSESFQQKQKDDIVNIKSKNPLIQKDIDYLKNQFQEEKKRINDIYFKKQKILKTQKKNEIKELRKYFRKKVNHLKRQHKDQIFFEKDKNIDAETINKIKIKDN